MSFGPTMQQTLSQTHRGRMVVIDSVRKMFPSWQNVSTPHWVGVKMCDMLNIPPEEKNDYVYVVLFSLEILDSLVFRQTNFDFVGPSGDNILFIADHMEEEFWAEKFYKCKTMRISRDIDLTGYMDNVINTCINHMSKNMKKKKVVVLMNPPYQLSDGGHEKSAKPIYQDFINVVTQTIEPEVMISIHPSRWMIGGKGLDSFRESFKADKRIEEIVDYKNSNEVFVKTENFDSVAGGVQIVKWNKNHNGLCLFDGFLRDINKYDVILRENNQEQILHKVLSKTNVFLNTVVSPSKPYGLRGDTTPSENGIPCWFKQSIGLSFVSTSEKILDVRNDINKWKILVPRAPIAGQTDFTKSIKFFHEDNVIVAKPGEICTETYIVLNSFSSENEARNFKKYVLTKFFRFMMSLRVISQDITKKCYAWVPDFGDYTKVYTDEMLIKMFGLTQEEWQYIESKIK